MINLVRMLKQELQRTRKESLRLNVQQMHIVQAIAALTGAKPKRRLSKDARRRIAEAQRKRWAASRKAKNKLGKSRGKIITLRKAA